MLAQRLLLGSTLYGDLTPLVRHYFDTATGPQGSSVSYERITEQVGHRSGDLLFISDVPAELDVAHAAGLQSLLCVRPEDSVPPPVGGDTVHGFDEIE